MLSHAPLLAALWRRLLSLPPSISFRLDSSDVLNYFRSFLATVPALCTQSLLPTYLGSVPPNIYPSNYLLSGVELQDNLHLPLPASFPNQPPCSLHVNLFRPPWATLTMSTLPSDVSPYHRALALVFPPCTVLLFI